MTAEHRQQPASNVHAKARVAAVLAAKANTAAPL